MLSFMNSQNTRTERIAFIITSKTSMPWIEKKNTCFCAIEMDVFQTKFKQLKPFVNGPKTSKLTKSTYNGPLQGSSFDIYGDVK